MMVMMMVKDISMISNTSKSEDSYQVNNKSQVEIRLINIDQAKEFLKKNPNCKSQILSDNQVVLIYSIDQTQRMTSLIKPVSMTLNKRTNEKTKQKIC